MRLDLLKKYYLFCFLFFFSINLIAQQLEMIAIANGISQGMQASYTTLDRNAYRNNNSEFNEDWHKWQFLNVTTAISAGVIIGLDNYNKNFGSALVDVWYFSGIRWIVASVTNHLHQGNPPFTISENSGSFTDNFNWTFRVIYFASALVVKYFLF